MSLKFLSAGRMECSRQILFLLLLIVSFVTPACRSEKSEKDSQISELQKDVKQLSDENRELLKEVQALREEIKPPQTEAVPAPAEPEPEPAKEITLEQVKTEVGPLLAEVIDKIKKTAETPRKDRQYGMRIEYDLKNAVYGLMNTQQGSEPAAKVIVKYEKFLESASDSRAYGTGNSIFVFAYQNDRWILLSYE